MNRVLYSDEMMPFTLLYGIIAPENVAKTTKFLRMAEFENFAFALVDSEGHSPPQADTVIVFKRYLGNEGWRWTYYRTCRFSKTTGPVSDVGVLMGESESVFSLWIRTTSLPHDPLFMPMWFCVEESLLKDACTITTSSLYVDTVAFDKGKVKNFCWLQRQRVFPSFIQDLLNKVKQVAFS